MGKKGKKKGNNEKQGSDAGPSQPIPQQQQQPQQQQDQPQQQHQQPQQQQVQQSTAALAQLNLGPPQGGDRPAGSGQQAGRGRGMPVEQGGAGQQQGQQSGRGAWGANRGGGRGRGQPQSRESVTSSGPSAASSDAGDAASVVSVGQGRGGQQGQQRGRGDHRGGGGGGGRGRGQPQSRESVTSPAPPAASSDAGDAASVVSVGQGRGGQQGQQRGRGDHRGGGGGGGRGRGQPQSRESVTSPAPSAASSDAGDAASVVSVGQGRGGQQGQQRGRGDHRGGGGGGGRGRGQPQSRESVTSTAPSTASFDAGSVGSGKKTTPISTAAGTAPVKTSLTVAQQSMYRDLIPKRKNPNQGGKSGRPITVETNMIPITFGPKFPSTICHYDVKFDPDRPKFMFRSVVEAVRLKHYPNKYPAFDGRCNLYAAGNLPFGSSLITDVEVVNPQRQRTMIFKVSINKAQDIDMSWLRHVKPGLAENERELTSVQALDVVLRSAPLRRQAITVGRSSFFQPEPGRAVDLGNGIDLWVGSFQATVLGWKPYFNIDVAHKGFPRSQPVLNLMRDICGDPRNPRGDISLRDIEYNRRKLEEYLRGLKVTYEIPGQPNSKRTMGINGLRPSSKEARFELPDHSVTTVENYFAREKRYRIRFPDYPTLWVGPRDREVLIPVELCTIEAGQVTNKKMDERQTSTMIKYAATNTETRKKKIMEGFSKMRFNEDPAMKEFGISVGGDFEKVKARVLDPPPLSDTRQIAVRKGVWRANSFHTAMVLEPGSWTILNLNERTQETPLRNLVENLKRSGRAVGMQIGDPLTPFRNMRAPMRDVRELLQFFNDAKKNNLKLIIVVVPDKTGPVYGKVKQVAELSVGVLTQCIKAVTVERKMNDATAGNILLKINTKLNGTNQIFTVGRSPPCLNVPCMIVGADVTHPAPDSVGIPSIAAVAASHSPTAFKYNVKIRLQPPRTEIILHLDEIMREQLLFFYKSTGHKPAKIIFYRDGVSEGQFPQVMHHELQAIRNACSKLSPGNKYEPKITFLVVQKRHHIRLFPTDMRNSDDRNGNVQAGTVVDTDITHPSHIDFYLVSHASIQGTARPTKYRCLWDDNDMCEDEIEQLTYYLCHMFARCTRSVSYPAPTYYAHLAAFRARALTNEVEIHLNNLEEEQRQRMTIKPEILTGNPMFFV